MLAARLCLVTSLCLVAFAGITVLQCDAQGAKPVFVMPREPAPPPLLPPAIEDRISQLMAQMTLEEKVGQLVQYSAGNATGPNPRGAIYEDMIRKGEVGSLLNVIGATETNRYQRIAVDESRSHIPLLFGYDVIHGYRTSFPIPLALAASFDPEMVREVGATAVDEARKDGVDWVFSPMVDIARDARWGRMAESNGEDPYLGSLMAAAWVRGIQHRRDDGTFTAACVKHFAAYGAPIAGRDYNAVDLSDRTLQQVYLPPYRAGVDAGALTVMSSFNSLNGIPMTANATMLQGTLRGSWDFRGMVVSDWGGIRELVNHGVAPDEETAAELALHAGVDIDMESDAYHRHLANLVQQGRIPMAELDSAVRRVLRVKFAIGLFEHPYTEPAVGTDIPAAHRALARRAAQETLVLLQNRIGDAGVSPSPLLPLSNAVRSVALLGPFADSQSEMLGSWSLPADPRTAVTLRSALSERLGGRLHYAKGTDILSSSTAGFDEALDAARSSEVTILALGESGPGMTGEATSRAHLTLPGNQEQLLEAVLELGKPVVLVLFSGRSLAIPWAAHHVPAILEAWAPGVEGGHAVADVLFGDVSPSGRLPVSFPYSVGQEPLFYAQNPTGRPATDDLTGPLRKGVNRFTSRYIDEATVPLFPFGWGLTYTAFQYSAPVPSRTEIHLNEIQSGNGMAQVNSEVVAINVTVTNVGSRTGTDLVQLYLHSPSLGVEQPLRRLSGFQRVTLTPHESRALHFTLSAQDLALYGADMKHVISPTLYTVFVGSDATTTNSTSFRIVEH